MPSSLPRGTPADQGVDPAAILSFLDALGERPDIEMHSLMVVRHGRVVAEGWWAPYSAGRPHLLYSLSKSFTATAAALAQAEGLLDLDDAVVSHFGEFAEDIADPRSRAVKIRHVASMASGHTREMLGEALARDPDEPVRGFLQMPSGVIRRSVPAGFRTCTAPARTMLLWTCWAGRRSFPGSTTGWPVVGQGLPRVRGLTPERKSEP